MVTSKFSAGDIIFREGDRSAAAYLIVEGEVEIRKGGKERAVWLAVLGEGEVFGEMGLVEERPRSATVSARTNVVLQQVAYHEFVDMLVNQPREGIRYIKRLMERLRLMSTRLANLPDDGDVATESELNRGHYSVKICGASPEAVKAVSDEGFAVERFPFRVGRASTRQSDDPLQNNHLKLMDSAPYNVSRNHFSIDLSPDGVLLEDRGSFLGTIVNGEHVGGDRSQGTSPLVVGDNQVVTGNPNSPFKFIISVQHLF